MSGNNMTLEALAEALARTVAENKASGREDRNALPVVVRVRRKRKPYRLPVIVFFSGTAQGSKHGTYYEIGSAEEYRF